MQLRYYVIEANVILVVYENKKWKDTYGKTILIPQGTKHRVENRGIDDLVFIEVQHGSYFGEDDIVRIEDDYNRK